VILSTGLTSYAYRGSQVTDVRILEVDEPGILEWKRSRLADARIAIPAGVRFVAVRADLADLACRLAEAGFRDDEPAFFSWLSIVPVMDRDWVRGVLRYVAQRPARIVFNYIEEVPHPSSPDATPAVRFLHNVASAARVQIQNMWSRHDLHAELDELGIPALEDLDVRALLTRYGIVTPPPPLPTEARIVLAATRLWPESLSV
jgi:methyltransferase (TIGR00027 family)